MKFLGTCRNTSPPQWEVLRREEGAVIVGKDGIEKQLPLDQAQKFSVFQRQKTALIPTKVSSVRLSATNQALSGWVRPALSTTISVTPVKKYA
jgi:hypothetical protein